MTTRTRRIVPLSPRGYLCFRRGAALPAPGNPLANTLRALRSRNYRLFFAGQSLSLVGTWITRIATSWLVYRLTGSVLLLGLVGFCGQLPTLLLSPFAGVLVDRVSRHRLLVWTQVASMVQSFALAALALTNVITVAHVLVLSVVQGIINAIDTPARQSLVVELIEDRADLPNAIALNSSMVNGARIVGPAIGGALIAAVGEGWCFLLDGISYVAVIASLLLMTVAPWAPAPRTTRAIDELVDGFRYVSGFAPVRASLLLLALVSTMGMPYTVLMPDFTAEVLGGGPTTLGTLMGASGAGALTGALYLASRTNVVGLGRWIVGGTLAFGGGLVVLGLSRSFWIALPALTVLGAGFMIQMAATNTILQTIVSEHLRGRVMSFYTMAFLGTAPIGSLIAGVLANWIGTPATIGAGGLACIVGGAWFAYQLPGLRELVRPIYRAQGILPRLVDKPP
jgi:MFS family permease